MHLISSLSSAIVIVVVVIFEQQQVAVDAHYDPGVQYRRRRSSDSPAHILSDIITVLTRSAGQPYIDKCIHAVNILKDGYQTNPQVSQRTYGTTLRSNHFTHACII